MLTLYIIYLNINIKEESLLITNGNYNYLEIPKYNIKKIIEKSDESLDKNYLYLYSSFEDNNIVLAGHNNRIVFKKIHNLNINDEIKLNYGGVNYIYKVIKNTVIRSNDLQYLENTHEQILTLITCVGNDNYRRIVISKLQHVEK